MGCEAVGMWRRKWRERDVVNRYGMRIAIVVYRNSILLNTYYLVRSSGARLKFVVRVLRCGFHRDFGDSRRLCGSMKTLRTVGLTAKLDCLKRHKVLV